ncbi:MAG: hypothetical protein DIU55_001420 [Bacillota bacterium]|nr:MAG: hypothetical protein DIU55_12060 [Bacillota bacterium]
MSTAFEEFRAVHDRYLSIMEHAYQTGETDAVASLLGPGYHGYYGMPDQDRAEYFDAAEALAGIRQTAAHMPGVRAGCVGRLIRMPSATSAVVFYEKPMEFGERTVSAFVLEVWRQVDGRWVLVRETVEHL